MTGEGDFQTTSARNSRTSANANSQMHNGSLPDGARRVLCVAQLTTSIQTNWSGVPRYGRSNAEPIDPFLHPLRWQLHSRSLLIPTTSDEFQTSVHTMDISARHHSHRRDISPAGELFLSREFLALASCHRNLAFEHLDIRDTFDSKALHQAT